MDWNKFKTKFHKTWHASIKPFIESNECNKIYAYLRSLKDIEIAPKSALTFRTFEQPLNKVKCVVLLDEPYSEKYNDIQYADGIPLSCEFINKLHPQLNAFYNAMEHEFYGLNVEIIKRNDLQFLISQGVLFLSSSLTTEIGCPGKHKKLWVPFIKHLIKLFMKKKIPILFIGEDVYEQYKKVIDPVYPWFLIKHNLNQCSIGVPWITDGVFTRLNKYLWDNTNYDEIMWVNMDVPY